MKLIRKTFGELSAKELSRILHCRSEVFVVEQHAVYQDLDFNDIKSTHLYFEHEGDIAAYLRILPPGTKYPQNSIGRLLTMPRYRKCGLARQLLTIAIEEVRQNNNLPIKIEAQAYLKDFYASMGFQPISDVYIFEELPHIDMLLDVIPLKIS